MLKYHRLNMKISLKVLSANPSRNSSHHARICSQYQSKLAHCSLNIETSPSHVCFTELMNPTSYIYGKELLVIGSTSARIIINISLTC